MRCYGAFRQGSRAVLYPLKAYRHRYLPDGRHTSLSLTVLDLLQLPLKRLVELLVLGLVFLEDLHHRLLPHGRAIPAVETRGAPSSDQGEAQKRRSRA